MAKKLTELEKLAAGLRERLANLQLKYEADRQGIEIALDEILAQQRKAPVRRKRENVAPMPMAVNQG